MENVQNVSLTAYSLTISILTKNLSNPVASATKRPGSAIMAQTASHRINQTRAKPQPVRANQNNNQQSHF
jgi:hypothetical protein